MRSIIPFIPSKDFLRTKWNTLCILKVLRNYAGIIITLELSMVQAIWKGLTQASKENMLPVGGKGASLVAQTIKHLPAMWETWVLSPGWEDTLEKEMATHSSTLAWKIPRMEEPGRLQSMGSQRVGHDWVTSLALKERAFPGGTSGKESACQCRTHERCGFSPWARKIPWRRIRQLNSSVLAWGIPWTEQTVRLRSTVSQRVGHNWSDSAMRGRQLVPWEL